MLFISIQTGKKMWAFISLLLCLAVAQVNADAIGKVGFLIECLEKETLQMFEKCPTIDVTKGESFEILRDLHEKHSRRMLSGIFCLCPEGMKTEANCTNSTNATCTPCSAGTYNDLAGSTMCKACEEGRISDAKASGCTECAPGKHESANACIKCERGKHNPNSGRSECTDCRPGTFNDATERTQCKACAAGKFQPDAGKQTAGDCRPCERGTFSASEGSSLCTDCAGGLYADTESLSKCKECPAGKYSGRCKATSISSCIACEKGKYQNNTGQSECMQCREGTYTHSKGQSTCISCPGGHQCISGVPIPCSEGYFKRKNEDGNCQKCEKGSYLAQCIGSRKVVGGEACAFCPQGKFQNERGRGACVSCPINTYNMKEGAKGVDKCLDCKDDVHPLSTTNGTKGGSSQSSCLCPSGYFFDSSTCKVCPIGATCEKMGTLKATLVTKPHYWRASKGTTMFLPCSVEKACIGGQIWSPPKETSYVSIFPAIGDDLINPTAKLGSVYNKSYESCEQACSANQLCVTFSFNADTCSRSTGYMYSDTTTRCTLLNRLNTSWLTMSEKISLTQTQRQNLFVDARVGKNVSRLGEGEVITSNDIGVDVVLGVDFQCRAGHTGPMCALCTESYAMQGEECVPCGKNRSKGEFLYVSWIATSILLFVIASFLLNIRDNRVKQLLLDAGSKDFENVESEQDLRKMKRMYSQQGQDNKAKKAAANRRMVSILKIVVTFLQIMSNLDSTFSVPWPSNFRWFLSSFDVFNFDIISSIAVVSPCDFSTNGFYQSFILHMLILPTFLAALVMAFYFRNIFERCIKRICKGKIKSAGAASAQLETAKKQFDSAKETLQRTEEKMNKEIEKLEAALKESKENAASKDTPSEVPSIKSSKIRPATNTTKTKGKNAPPSKSGKLTPTKNDKPSPKGPTPKDIRQKLNKLKVTKSESLSELKRDMQKKKRSLGKLSSLKSVVKAEQQAARERIVRWGNYLTYLLYPGMTVRQFQLYSCNQIDTDTFVLSSDNQIQCYTEEWYSFVYGTSGFMLIYVIGIPAYTWYQLYSNHELFTTKKRWLREEVESKYGALFLPYKKSFWYWEVIEMIRKMLLTGGMVLVAPGSSSQILWAEIVCLIYLLLVLKAAPFQNNTDDWLAFAASLQLFFVFMSAFALKTDSSDSSAVYEPAAMGVCLCITSIGVILLGIVVLFNFFSIGFKQARGNKTKKVQPVNPAKNGKRKPNGNKSGGAKKKKSSRPASSTRSRVDNKNKRASRAWDR